MKGFLILDDIMYVLVAGRLRTDVLPVFEGLLSKIKVRLFQKRIS
jgi:hypothetical protein